MSRYIRLNSQIWTFFFPGPCKNLVNSEFINCAITNYYAHQAARKGNLDLVKYLHKAGANLSEMDNEKNTPILLAALNGHYSIVKYLYDNGVGHHATIPNTEPDNLYTDNLRIQ